MDSKTKKNWLKALRSGEYKQGEAALRKEANDGIEKFCCLGVLCDLVEPNQWRRVAGHGFDEAVAWCNGPAGNNGIPRKDLLEKLGLNRKISRSNRFGYSIAEKLAYMNDNGKNFTEIANWIEQRTF